jgi:hypothetical protein
MISYFESAFVWTERDPQSGLRRVSRYVRSLWGNYAPFTTGRLVKIPKVVRNVPGSFRQVSQVQNPTMSPSGPWTSTGK